MFSRFATQVPKAAIASAPLVGAAAFAQQQQTENWLDHRRKRLIRTLERSGVIPAAVSTSALSAL